MNFRDLNLISPILQAAQEVGYTRPSPIQEKAIPLVLAGRDLLGCAQTGTGKTAAFAMPILQRLHAAPPPKGKRPIRALVLTPTRELALQIDENFAAYGKHLPLRHCVIFGGVGQAPQVARLKAGVDILTATPGRLNDLVAQGHIDLSRVEIFVLDEADRMLDMGFVQDVRRVIRQLPQKRQTLLFSATMPKEIEELASSILTDPAKVMVTPPSTTVEAIDQSVYFVDKGNKRHLLASLLQNPDIASALVFTRTKHGADRVVRELGRAGVRAMAIHGNKSQNARQAALGQFKDGELRVLVATDIAARGIDVSGLTHVINYDLPNVPETYVHRIGRTGRAGRPGIALSFCSADEMPYLADIETLARIHVPVKEHAWPMQETPVAQAPPPKAKHKPAPRTQKQPTPPKPTPQTTQGENTVMEETKVCAPNTSDQESKNPAKRRRRGGRRHNKANKQAAAQPAAPQAEQKPAPTAAKPAPAAAKQAPAKQAAEKPAGAKGQRPAQKEKAQQRTPSGGKSARWADKPLSREPATPLPEVDDSIQLISRKAPTQKYASFEEYMKDHG